MFGRFPLRSLAMVGLVWAFSLGWTLVAARTVEAAFETIQDLSQQAAAQQETPDKTPPANPKLVDFAKDVAPILKNRCGECHLGPEAKEGFDVSSQDSLLGMVEAGSVENSSLWNDYLNADPNAKDSLLMPPASKGGRLPVQELAVIQTWIREGAEWKEFPSDAKPSEVSPKKTLGLLERLWVFCGYFHPAIIHFPIALISIGGASLLISFFTGKRAEDFALVCLVLGSMSSIFAAMMGWSLASIQGYPSWTVPLAEHRDSTLFWHRWLGTSISVLGPLFSAMGLAVRRESKWSRVWKVGLLGLAMLVGWVGHQGGELKYGEQFFHQAFDTLMGTE